MLTINVEMLATKWEMLARLSEMLDLRFTTSFRNFVECEAIIKGWNTRPLREIGLEPRHLALLSS